MTVIKQRKSSTMRANLTPLYLSATGNGQAVYFNDTAFWCLQQAEIS